MSESGYKIKNQSAPHFLTFAVVGWIDVFTRKLYRDIIIDSLQYCQREKGLVMHSWCIMSNHLHLIMSASDHNLSRVLADFKKFTSKEIITAIVSNPKESRKDWMLPVFHDAGQKDSRITNFQFWRKDNRPQELYSRAFTYQKVDYIHNNPVAAGIVDRPEDYLYSSAKDYFVRNGCGKLDLVFL